MTTLTRIKQLEKINGVQTVKKYMCVTGGMTGAWDTIQKAKGYKVQPFMTSCGGTGGEPFYIATRAELDEFAARPEVDLDILVFGCEDKDGDK